MKLHSLNAVFLCGVLFGLAGCGPSTISKGARALELGDYPLAIALFSRVLESDPANSEARLGIGKAYLQRAADNADDTTAWKTALMHLDAARTLSGSSIVTQLVAEVWTERGAELLTRGDTLQALTALSRAIALDEKRPEPLNLAGIIYYRTGRTVNARRLFERALSVDSANLASLFNLGMLCWEEQEAERAHALWLQALKCAPDDEEILYWFAAAEKRLREQASPMDSVP